MTREEAERWCTENEFEWYSFKMPDQGVPGRPMSEGKVLWDLTGWAWKKDPKKGKERIHYVGEYLEVLVERAKQRVDWVRTT